LVFAHIGDTGGRSEEESLDGDDIDGIDSVNAINIRGGQAAPGERNTDPKEMALDRDDVDGGNTGRTWRNRGFAWSDSKDATCR
jgi:hypothetical protein